MILIKSLLKKSLQTSRRPAYGFARKGVTKLNNFSEGNKPVRGDEKVLQTESPENPEVILF